MAEFYKHTVCTTDLHAEEFEAMYDIAKQNGWDYNRDDIQQMVELLIARLFPDYSTRTILMGLFDNSGTCDLYDNQSKFIGVCDIPGKKIRIELELMNPSQKNFIADEEHTAQFESEEQQAAIVLFTAVRSVSAGALQGSVPKRRRLDFSDSSDDEPEPLKPDSPIPDAKLDDIDKQLVNKPDVINLFPENDNLFSEVSESLLSAAPRLIDFTTTHPPEDKWFNLVENMRHKMLYCKDISSSALRKCRTLALPSADANLDKHLDLRSLRVLMNLIEKKNLFFRYMDTLGFTPPKDNPQVAVSVKYIGSPFTYPPFVKHKKIISGDHHSFSDDKRTT
eukprot:TCONS_00021948-protein